MKIELQRPKQLLVAGLIGLLCSCTNQNNQLPSAALLQPQTTVPTDYRYLIGTDDELEIFVWRNEDLSGTFTVRPDGKITTSLIEDLKVSGKTPSEVAREMETVLARYVRDPIVTVTVSKFYGPFNEQIRIIGEATNPRAIPYRQHMTLLDAMIMVGGLTTFADGNSATLIRIINGKQKQYELRLDDLIRDGDISANADMLPGDIIIIPETWF